MAIKRKPESHMMMLRVPKPIHTKLVKLAAADQRSTSALAVLVLRRYVEGETAQPQGRDLSPAEMKMRDLAEALRGLAERVESEEEDGK